MTLKSFKIAKIIVSIFVAITVVTAVGAANIFLALGGIIIGMIALLIARSRVKEIIVDERIMSASQKATQSTYAIVVMTMGFTSVLIMLFNTQNYFPYLESMALLFAYITIFIIVVYHISYRYFIHKTGGHDK